jgi:polysaccharide biosynthesis protein PelF
VTRAADLDVALVTEGTYPFHHGGVTVWCDQLIRGLPDRRFGVVAITGSGDEQPVLALPPNLVQMRTVPLWGPTPRRSHRRSRGRAASVAEAHERFLDALTDGAADPEGQLLEALGRLHELAQAGEVAGLLRERAALERVHECLRSSGSFGRTGEAAAPTVGDALAAGDLIEHFLRPLWAAPPSARLTHCASNGLPALVGLSAKWTFGTGMLLTEHGVYLRERYLATDARAYSFPVRALVLRFFRVLTGAAYRAADLITPGSEYNQRWQVRIGADEELIQPVHNGVDPEDFPPAGDEPSVPTLAWVGRVDPLKDLETLIQAFALVRRRVPNARLRMFGPTPTGNEPYRLRCEGLVASLGLAGAAAFEGRVESITDAYGAGHVIALTSVSEGFPYTVIEAMASMRATVSTDVGGVREAVGDAGLVVAPRDVEAVADACTRLLVDGALRRRMAAGARARVMERFTLGRFLDVYRGIYDACMADAVAARPRPLPEPEVRVDAVGAVA